MRIAVLASPNSWYVRDLQRAAEHRDTITPLPFTQIGSRIGTTIDVAAGEVVLDDYDAVLVRTMPPGSLEQVVFRMDALAQVASRGTLVLNSPKAIEVAVDKYLTLCRLHAAGFEVPRTETSQTVEAAMASFARLGHDVVLKPIFGSEGRGITRITDEAIAERTFKLLTQLGAVIYLQEFVPHEGYDVRLLVIGDEVLGMRRSNQLDWRTNVSRGARTERFEVSTHHAELARRAASAVGAVLAGVDVLPTRDGRELLIEVNAVPGWRALAKQLDIDVAARILATVRRLARGRE